MLANRTSLAGMALDFKGESRSDQIIFKNQGGAPQIQPLWSCAMGGRGELLLGGLILSCSSCLFWQPAGQHSFAVNHQNLGSDVKQME